MIARNPNEKRNFLKPVLIGALALALLAGLIVGGIKLFSSGKKEKTVASNSGENTENVEGSKLVDNTTDPSNPVNTDKNITDVTPIPTVGGDGKEDGDPDTTVTPTPIIVPEDDDGDVKVIDDFDDNKKTIIDEVVAELDPNVKDIRKLILDITPVSKKNFDTRFVTPTPSPTSEPGKTDDGGSTDTDGDGKPDGDDEHEDYQRIIDDYVAEITDEQILQFHNFLVAFDSTRNTKDFEFLYQTYVDFGHESVDFFELSEGIPLNILRDNKTGISKRELVYYYPYYVQKNLRSISGLDVMSCIIDMRNHNKDELPTNNFENYSVRTVCENECLFWSFLNLAYCSKTGNLSKHDFTLGCPTTLAPGVLESYMVGNEEVALVVPVKDNTDELDILVLFNADNDLIGAICI